MGEPRASEGCPRCGVDYVPGIRFCSNCGYSFTGLDATGDSGKLVPPGTMLGKYRVLELLGEGGMGRVYSGEHTKLGRRVAIKILRSEFSSNPVAISRFFAEARAVNVISHENIVQITDFLERESGWTCIIMELLAGEDLGARLHRDTVLPLYVALDITAQIASALVSAHAARIIHRDLKPDNVFLTERPGRTNFVKLLDFGVAKLASGPDGIAMHTTAAGQIVGTPEYMSPEQAAGRAVDHRTDIYAVGAMLYQMVTGRLPFVADNFGDLIIKHMSETPVPPSQLPDLPRPLPPGLDGLILQLLARDPHQRPWTMAVVEERIRSFLDDISRPPMTGSTSAIAPDGSGPALKRITSETTGSTRALSPGGSGPIAKKITGDTTGRIRAMSPGGSGPIANAEASRDAHAATIDVAAAGASSIRITGSHRVQQSGSMRVVETAAPEVEPAVEPVSKAAVHEATPTKAPRTLLIATAIAVLLVVVVAVIKLGDSKDDRPRPPTAGSAQQPAVAPVADEITIKFKSKPVGATVRIAGSPTVLGVTPFSHRFPRSDKPVSFEFELQGYYSLTEEMAVDADTSFTAALARLPRVLGPPR